MRFAVSVLEPAGYKYSHFLYDLCKYICYSIESVGYDCCIQRNKMATDRTNILVGSHNQTDPAVINQIKQAGPYILLQTEVIRGDSINNWNNQKSFAAVYLPLMRQATAVWTGSEENIAALKKLHVEADMLLWGYHPLMEEIHHKKNKDIDFLFSGSISAHRKKLLDQLMAHGCKVVTMFDDAAMYRNDLIARARVNLAPNHGAGLNHLGKSRVLYMVNNRAIVVVEKCFDQAMYEQYFPWAETERWVDLCMETLRRPDLAQVTEEYYDRFKQIRMADFMGPLIEKFLERIKTGTTSDSSKENTSQPANNADRQLSENSYLPLANQNIIPGMTSIIIVTQNRLDQTKKCLKRLRKHTPEPHEIIFVDDGSTDGTVKWLQSQARENKNCLVIENAERTGSAAARNLGVQAAQGENILLLTSDVLVGESWLSGMLGCLNQPNAAGIVGPITNQAEGLRQVLNDGNRSPDYLDQFTALFRDRYRHRRISTRKITGFCMLFSRALIKKIGMLDEQFSADALEAEDLCLRAELTGHNNFFAGDVFVHRLGEDRNRIDRKIFDQKWTLGMSTPAGKKLAVLKATELAEAFYAKGNMNQAVETLVNCIKFSPNDPQIYYNLIRFFIESKKFAEAWDVVGTMPDVARESLRGLEYAGYAKEGLGLDDDAVQYAEKMLSLNKNYPAALNLQGVLAFKKGEKQEARKFFENAIAADPGYAEAYTNLGVLSWGLEQQEEAFEHLKKGFILSPATPDTSSLYYSVVSSLGRFSEAEADFAEACRLHPNHKNLAFLHIDILIQQDKFDSAIIKIEDALDFYGLDEGMLNAALAVRQKIGPLQIEKASKKGTLSLCMIVKNEEKHLIRCLKSVRDVVDEMIIVDTGSTDKTVDIARVFGAKLYDFPWTGDFAVARNESLKYATGDWTLILDADEVISRQDFGELKTLISKRTSKPVAYSIVTRNYMNNMSVLGWTANIGEYPEEAGPGWVPSAKVRLAPRRKDVFFINPVHELLENSLKDANIPFSRSKIVVHHYGKLDMAKDAQKGRDYYLLGKIKYESDPTNAKYIYELAKQAHLLNKYEETVDLWQQLLVLIEDHPQSPAYQQIAKITYGDPLGEIYIQLAAAYLLLGRYEEALKTASKAMECKNRLKEYVHIYAYCEIVSGSLEKASRALQELLETTPDYIPALIVNLVVLCLEGKKEEVHDLFQFFRKKRAGITIPLNKFARQLHDNGRKDQAMLILRTLREEKMSNAETQKLSEEYQKEKAG